MPISRGGSSLGGDGVTLGISNGNLYVINDAHTHETQYLELDGSNANTAINVGSQNFITAGDVTCRTLGFTNFSPATPSSGWSVTAGYTPDKTFNPKLTNLNEVANVLGTVVDTLKSYGLLGA